jgi:hypothetical protein
MTEPYDAVRHLVRVGPEQRTFAITDDVRSLDRQAVAALTGRLS